ncbi:site-specific integrase [Segetibacter aerophilus]|uniref:Transposase n=1 Tax=Segetibacter aerophilus TaxID=670293 RepID=A0A512B9T8_9BACT|nr:site-specific integrase [Segetibacter aerophilus]GEO08703.1 transposase [Segetibacter aerophilus]
MTQNHTFSLLSYIRRDKANKDSLAPVYLRITLDGKRAEISTKTFVDPLKWNAAKGRLKSAFQDSKRLNQTIETFEHRAREVYNRLIEKGKILSADDIKDELLGSVHKQRTLVLSFSEYLAEMEARVTIDFSIGTIKNWRVTLGHLKEFLVKKYSRPDIAFKELDENFLREFDSYARRNWGCGTNAVIKHIQRIRKIVTKAISKNWLDKDPFIAFATTAEKTHRTFLTPIELDAIEKKIFELDRLEKVKDIFIFSCYTGLAYVDVEKLTTDNLVVGIDSKKWIYTFREKTNEKSNIPLLPKALQIIEKYKNDSQSSNRGKLLPVISNIKTNAYLKEIADVCGIKKNLTFHMARHTFATTITLTNGVPIETVSNMLGHSKITTTQIYAKVLENKVSVDMDILERKLSRL